VGFISCWCEVFVEEVYDKGRHLILVRLPRPVEVAIEDTYLNLLGTTKPSMGYHISLLGPFHLLEGGAPETALSGVPAVCQRWEPFAVRISGLNVFRSPDQNVVYLDIVNPALLVALHRDLLEATAGLIIPQDDRYREWTIERYQPHVTLGLGLSDKELDSFLHSGLTHKLDESLEIKSIWLAGQAAHGPWRYLEEYPFGEMDRGAVAPSNP
jgi:2'-5' RNA ligase